MVAAKRRDSTVKNRPFVLDDDESRCSLSTKWRASEAHADRISGLVASGRATGASQIDEARRWISVTFPHEQPEAMSRRWGRELTRQEIAEAVRRTLPLRVLLVEPIALDELREQARPGDAIAAAA